MEERGDVLTVSNRLAVNLRREEDGQVTVEKSDGGVVTALSGMQNWIGYLESHPRLTPSTQAEIDRLSLCPVFIPDTIYRDYYEGYANRVIWPLFHDMAVAGGLEWFFSEWWEAAGQAMELFLEEIRARVRDGDTVWIHDYHLMRLPAMLRREKPNLKIGFFLHIPFPRPETFEKLPQEWQKAIIEGLLGADLIGVHTEEYARNLCEAVARVVGVMPQNSLVSWKGRFVRIGAFPLGIDAERLREEALSDECEEEYIRYLQEYNGLRVLLGVDRLDYTKGIPHRLRAFEKFFERNPQWIGKVVFVQIAVPSRTGIPEYQTLKAEVEELVGRINSRFGANDYLPVVYRYGRLDKNRLYALYRRANATLVTSLRDGMNLVALEAVVVKGGREPGVLILSRHAGAAEQLPDALLVNPYDEETIVRAIERALSMTREAQIGMMRNLYEGILPNSSMAWKQKFLTTLERAHALNVV